eukprot:4407998-Pyramimonas_sp.AAC.1
MGSEFKAVDVAGLWLIRGLSSARGCGLKACGCGFKARGCGFKAREGGFTAGRVVVDTGGGAPRWACRGAVSRVVDVAGPRLIRGLIRGHNTHA